jgi:hypothetical protein
VNINVEVDPEVWKKFKILAIERDTTVADLLATLVEQEVKETGK